MQGLPVDVGLQGRWRRYLGEVVSQGREGDRFPAAVAQPDAWLAVGIEK